MPDGREIMIAREKPKAITTKNALIFLLDKFLIALVKAPKPLTVQSFFYVLFDEPRRGSNAFMST